MMRLLLPTLLVTVLAGCEDAATTAPFNPPPASQPPSSVPTVAALQDALDRIVPTLGPSRAVTGVRSILIALLEEQAVASLPALASALDLLPAKQADAAVEVEAIRLAMIQR